MDKYEYQIRADEIKALIAEGEFAEAVKIADTIDWRRVRSVMMLCTISDLYKVNRRYRESKDILLLAYEKHPTARSIVYSLCELSIKMEEYVQAIEYYKEFVQIAPKDTGRYILQYRLYEAQDVSLEERIEVLKEFKKHDYREKWAYELAYLYHRIGLATQCVEECDEMFIMFGEGKYIIKALELKALHTPLSEDQQAKYDKWVRQRKAGEEPSDDEQQPSEDYEESLQGDTQTAGRVRHADEEGLSDEQEVPAVPTMELPEVKTVDLGQYNTINLQMALAESMKEILNDDEASDTAEEVPEEEEEILEEDEEASERDGGIPEEEEEVSEGDEEPFYEDETAYSKETFYEDGVDTEDDEDEDGQMSIAETLIAPLLEETVKMPAPEEVEEKLKETPVIAFPGKTEPGADKRDVQPPRKMSMDTGDLQEISAQIAQEDTAALDAKQILEQMKQETIKPQQKMEASTPDRIPGARTGVLTPLNTKPSKFDNILSQEYDGQISLVVPETERVEKQITGQLSIEDIMAEWEEMKKTNKQKRMEEVKQRILDHTGNLFADFDEATKNGLLEELEKAFIAAIMKDSGKKSTIRKVILPENADEPEPTVKRQSPDVEKYVAAAVKEFEKELAESEPEDEVEELEEIEEPVLEETGEKLEETAAEEETAEETAESKAGAVKQNSVEMPEDNTRDRELTPEEMELFGQFVHHRKSKRQLIHVLDNMSLASCTGNVVITGEEEITTLTLAKALIKEMQLNDDNFSGKVAKISANVLNKKDVAETFARLDNGALIIEKASRLKPATAVKMAKVLEKDNMGLLLLLIDKKQDINQLFADNAVLNNNINLRVDIEPLDNEALVAYAKQYAEEMEYSIDEFGILALHTRIADRQTSDHEVSMAEVRELVDEAIHYANKKTPKHFMDILLAKRYDEEDMIILREKDFMHY